MTLSLPDPPHAAVIFDVDGPLLRLTIAETKAFFQPFAERHGLTDLSEDWDSYRIRNDVEIYRDIMTRVSSDNIRPLLARYLDILRQIYANGDTVSTIPGALGLLKNLTRLNGLALGTATANFESVAEMRLRRADMWTYVRDWHSGAEGGGSKCNILERVIKRLNLPPERIVFLGDNLNDLEAAETHGTHFIGFHLDAAKRHRLLDAGAKTVTGNHTKSYSLIREFLGL